MVDWDALVLGPVMGIFGEGDPAIEATLPLFIPMNGAQFRLADAVFDAEFEQVDVNPDDGTTTTSRRPVLGVRLSRFSGLGRGPQQSDVVMIPGTGKTYVVRDIQPDGHGHAKLMLMEMKS